MPAGSLRSALDTSFLAASSGAELRSKVGSPLDVRSTDPVEDFAAWLLRLGGAVKQTILDWTHWPLPSGINPSERNEFFGWAGPERPLGPQDANEAARLHAGLPMTEPHAPAPLTGPVRPRHSGINMWHPTARNALYYEINNPNAPNRPPDWPRGVDWPPRAIIDKNGKWWPPPGWANGAGAEKGCELGYWTYSCGWRNREEAKMLLPYGGALATSWQKWATSHADFLPKKREKMRTSWSGCVAFNRACKARRSLREQRRC
ncbi:CBS [Symbiodinium pilosum]|uniref:CBS protein n=1 Tax=Symbiodinium pilosum TaxID=2952 RepID=A0A812MWT3_SYMPI|nr:CBS [Symbiodinium pilosum]